MAASQQYCLRWNNHRSNLLTVFDQLLQTEAFTDVTLACEGGASVKCHKMVLAACSSYFETLFMDQQCRHPIVILKDVKYTEIKNILEYMYRGEVNVAQDQLPGMLKVAEALKVKGLGDGVNDGVKLMEDDPNTITTSSAPTSQPVPHSSSVNNSSPPHSTGIHNQGFPKVPYLYGKSPVMERVGTGGRLPMWGMPGIPLTAPPPSHTHAAAVLNSCYEAAMDMPPLRRKKLSSLLMSRGGDTPILRTVLGQGQADSSQPMSLICHPETERNHTNGSPRDIEKSMKTEPSEDTPSPYTDIGFIDDESSERANRMMIPSSSPQSAYGENKAGGVSSGIATYVPTQKPEWKRYKQYTRNDIMSAIEAVRTGMSALQAARKYGVPSRTLYDKVKKLGITSGRPFRRSSIGNGGPGFPYGFAGSGSMMFSGGEEEGSGGAGGGGYNNNMDQGFLHHTLEPRNNETDREAAASVNNQQSNTSNHSSSSPGNNGRSPSPSLIHYAHRNSMTPSPPPPAEQEEDRVEDLSMARKPEPASRVIMPPMSQAAATAMLTTGSDTHMDSRD